MKILRHILPVVMAFMAAALPAMADIVENLNRPGSTVTLEQPSALAERLILKGNEETTDTDEEATDEEDKTDAPAARPKGRMVGYRVQVYADNNQRVAKGEARYRERAISSRFPALGTYVAYASPYWRLRVGDFRTQAEAEKVAADIRRAFPSYAKEVRVVRDRVIIR